jgi:O-antigen ligase
MHNIYLQYAAERGIPTMLAFLWMLAIMLRDFLRALKTSPAAGDARFVLRGCVATMIAILTGGIFEHNLGDSEVLALFLTAMSCGYAAVESVRHEGA